MKLYLRIVFLMCLTFGNFQLAEAKKIRFDIGFSFIANDPNPQGSIYLGTITSTYFCTSDTVEYVLNRSINNINNFYWAIYNAGDLSVLASTTGTSITINGNYPRNISDIRISIYGDSSSYSLPTYANLHIIPYIISSPGIDLGNDVNACPGTTIPIFNKETNSNPNFGQLTSTWFKKTGASGIYSSITGLNTITAVALENVEEFYLLRLKTVIQFFPNPTCEAYKEVKVKGFVKPEVKAGNDTSRCFGETLTLSPSLLTPTTAPYSYLWSPSNNLSNPTAEKPVVGDNETQNTRTYTLVLTDGNGCKDTATVNITKNPEITFNIVNTDTTLCSQNKLIPTVIASGGTTINGSYLFKWSPSVGLSADSVASPTISPVSTSGINYVATLTDKFGCKKTDQIKVSKTNLRAFFNSTKVDSLCSGNSINNIRLRVLGGKTPYTYNWSPNSILIKQSDSLYNTSAITSNQKILAAVTDANGCIEKDSMLVRAIPLPVPSTSASPIIVCIGTEKELPSIAPAGSNESNYGYSWFPSNNLSSTSSAKPIASGFNDERQVTYNVTVTDIANGCAGTGTVVVESKAFTPFEVRTLFEKAIVDTVLNFKAEPAELSYTWTFVEVPTNNVIATKTGAEVGQEFNTINDHKASIAGINTFGCVSNKLLEFRTLPKSSNFIFIPEIFSPNAADENNKNFKVFFVPQEIKNDGFKVEIYNVLGQKIFETTDKQEIRTNGWDASNYPSGVYNYVVKGSFIDDTPFNKFGEVVLVK